MSSIPPTDYDTAQPEWNIPTLFPPQGSWSEEEYLGLTESTNKLVEFTNGQIEFLAMPTKSHQRIVVYLCDLLRRYLVAKHLGDAISAPYRVRLTGDVIREPDVVAYLTQHLDRFGEEYGGIADLVMEVVSKDAASRERDWVKKRIDYAEAGIPEYWVVDPFDEKITVLKLDGTHYAIHGEFVPGDVATSHLLDGFSVDVASVFQAAKE